jgi:hypothetical protein
MALIKEEDLFAGCNIICCLNTNNQQEFCNPLLFRVDAILYKNLNFRMACHVGHILDSHLLAE